MADTTVSTVSGLNSALNTASPGDTIFLMPGTYAGISKFGTNRGGWVTIRSQNPANRAVLTYFRLDTCQKLTFTDLEFDLTGSANAFEVWRCTDMIFTDCYVHGPTSGTILDVIDNLVNGFDARWNTRLTISGNEFYRLYNGIGNAENTDVVYTHNYLHDIRCDGINGSGIVGGVISDNYFTDFYPQGDVGGDGDHPDAIQLWTKNSSYGSSNVLIENNKMVRGLGHSFQGVFNVKDAEAPYDFSNITIRGNVLIGCSFNSIRWERTAGLTIADNIIASYPDEVGYIKVNNSTTVSITNNLAPSIDTATGNSGVTTSGNSVGSWQPIAPGATVTLTRQQTLSLQTVGTSETPANDVALATVDYRDGAGNTGSLVTTTISVDIAA